MTLARQYAAKLITNVVSLLTGLVTVALVPRILGPSVYGRYEFLTNIFQQVKTFLDMGTSTCFYTRLSQTPGDESLVAFYRRLMATLSALVLGGAAVLSQVSAGASLFAGEGIASVLLAAAFACATWWLDSVRKMIDAYRLTVAGEIAFASLRAATVAVLALVIWWLGLSLQGYLAFLVVTTVLTALVLEILCARRKPAETMPGRRHLAAFWDYSQPLLLYSLVGMATAIADRWILQTHAGAAEQGYYGLAYQVGAVCFLFTSAMTQLLLREFAVSWDQRDLARMRELFRRTAPALYATASYFCVFVAFHGSDVAWLVGGKDFENGSPALAIMVLYPMHQTYGQIVGSVFYATGQTRLYRNVGIATMLAGLPVMYWLVAAGDSGGLALGAQGLAIKVVLLQAIAVNVGLRLSARVLELKDYGHFVAHQVLAPAACVLCAIAADGIPALLSLSRLPGFLATGAFYTLLVAVTVYFFPTLAGVQRAEMSAVIRRCLSSGGKGR